jgi:hypothetical protein
MRAPLVKGLARVPITSTVLDEGHYASISEMATAERTDRGYLGPLLQLTLLAPTSWEAIGLGGNQMSECPRLAASLRGGETLKA